MEKTIGKSYKRAPLSGTVILPGMPESAGKTGRCGKKGYIRNAGRCGKTGLSAAFLTAMLSLLLFLLPETSLSAFAATVEYDSLRQQLTETSPKLDTLNENLSSIEKQIEEIRTERAEFEIGRDNAKEDGDSASQDYYQNTLDDLTDMVTSLKKNYTKQSSSTADTLNSLEKSAKTLMISYHQVLANAEAAEKEKAAAEAAYKTVTDKYAVGLAGETDMITAYNSMQSSQNRAESLAQQLASVRRSLLTLLGISDSASVTIGEIPEPDLNAIDAIDFDKDCETYSWFSDEMTSAKRTTSSDWILRETAVREASGNAVNTLTTAYQSLQAARKNYEAQRLSFEASEKQYDIQKRKKEAGMLTQAAFLKAEAQYAAAQASLISARLNLLEQYETYQWTLRDIW